MLDRVKKTLKKFDMVSQGEKVVLGVSGGADSIAMMHALHEINDPRLELIVAHLNHGIRGEEAKRDADFVREAARKLRLKYFYGEVDTPSYGKEQGLSLEEAARILRYRFLHDVSSKQYAKKIATAHTLDDQAETVLMRLLRGSGSRGLSGIPPVLNNTVIRPLIETTRADVEEYLKSRKIAWVEDSTNQSEEHLRNRIRGSLIPDLEQYNPRIKETLAKTADIMRIEEEYVRNEALNCFDSVFDISGNDILGNLTIYGGLEAALRYSLLRECIERISSDLRNVSSTHVSATDEFLLSETPSGEIELPGDTVVAKGYDRFIITTRENLDNTFSYQIPAVGKWSFPEFEFIIDYVKTDELSPDDESVAHFDPDTAPLPLQVKSFAAGDRFYPLGMMEPKKLQDYFTDIKMPRFMRQRVPLFTCRGEIMWIGGLRIDERFKVRNKDNEVLRIKLLRHGFS